MINQVVLTGRLTRKPELKKTQSGDSYTFITLAQGGVKRKDGSQSESVFIDVTVWRQPADYLCNYAEKGNVVSVIGHVTVRKDNQGHNVVGIVADNVENLSPRSSDGQTQQNNRQQRQAPARQVKPPVQTQAQYVEDSYGDATEFNEFETDDLPFY